MLSLSTVGVVGVVEGTKWPVDRGPERRSTDVPDCVPCIQPHSNSAFKFKCDVLNSYFVTPVNPSNRQPCYMIVWSGFQPICSKINCTDDFQTFMSTSKLKILWLELNR